MKMKKLLIFLVLFACKIRQDQLPSNDNWIGEKYSGFSNYQKVSGKNFMIATADNSASKAGAEILAKGGNAVDAAIAAQMVLNVVEPQSSGIGGGLFLLYFDAKTKKTIYFNGRETAPIKAHDKIFLDEKGQVRDFADVVNGGLSVATPGALKALFEAHQKYGKISWNELFHPAIKLAREGFLLDSKIHAVLEQLPHLQRFGDLRIYFNDDGSPKKIGSLIKNPQLAKTFETIANKGIEAFYRGEIAKNIVEAVTKSKTNPGYLSLTDLANYQVKTGELLCGSYRKKYKICSMPLPSSGGVTILQMLGILENFDLTKLSLADPKFVHLFAESARLAYADRNEYVADLPNVPIKEMLDKNYLRQRARLISLDKSLKKVEAGKFTKPVEPLNETLEKPSTTHLAIVDKYGNAVSMTSSIEYLFGSALMVDGFMLNNELTDFSLSPEISGKKVANRVQPQKQPRSSMSPVFVFDEKDNLIMSVGSPGGPAIIQYVAKTIVAHLDFGLDIQQAISAPNFVALRGRIELEDRTELPKIKSDLEKIGHKVVVTDITSGIQGVVIGDQILIGGADPRRRGSAIGDQ
jgi:gamma-glutamyltranspeptidase/glutathione hydrolase